MSCSRCLGIGGVVRSKIGGIVDIAAHDGLHDATAGTALHVVSIALVVIRHGCTIVEAHVENLPLTHHACSLLSIDEEVGTRI